MDWLVDSYVARWCDSVELGLSLSRGQGPGPMVIMSREEGEMQGSYSRKRTLRE